MYVSHQLSADRRRGWTISIIVHALILLLAFLPFLTHLPQEDISQVIAIQFERPVQYEDLGATMQSGAEAAAAASSESESSPEAQAPREQVNVAAVSPLQPTSAMPVPSRSITMTEVNPEVMVPVSKASSSKADRFFDQPLEVEERVEIDRVEAFKEKPNPALQQKVTWHVVENESSEGGAPTSFDFGNGQGSGKGNESGKSSGTGTNGSAPNGQGEDAGFDPFADGSFPDGKGSGTGNAGKNSGVGQDGKGLHWGDFAGDGLFNRKVIKRADVAKIAVQQGKVVINLCVDQLGRVVYSQYDAPNSSIRDKTIVAKAEECAKQYVFDEDPSAPREQCGRLTFIFEIKM